jgi:hypothetical protein
MADAVHWRPLLRDALAALASSADEQLRANGPGCIACDLLEDLDHARLVAVGNAELSESQRQSLDRIDGAALAMLAPDLECFNNEVVQRPAWAILRNLAGSALREFGWGDVRIQVFVETQPGLWHRPPSET